ncbi:MAG: EAL domain-containing protein [Motiliproteus sp.]
MDNNTEVSDELSLSLLEASSDSMLLIKDDRFIDCNRAALAMLGYEHKDTLLSMRPCAISPSTQADGQCSNVKAKAMIALANSKGFHRFEWLHQRATGEKFPVEVVLTQVIRQGQALLHVALIDISEHETRLRRLALSKVYFDNTSDAIVVADQYTQIIDVNPAFSKITGYSRREAVGQKSGFMGSGRHGADFYREMWKQLIDRGYWEGEVWDRHKNGNIFPKYLKISSVNNRYGLVENFIGIFSDISEQKKHEEEIRRSVFFDPLTQLPNRRLFIERIEHLTQQYGRKAGPIGVLAIDIDNFKLINDTQGHSVGDQLLVRVAQRLEKQVRKSDTLARMGGDDFMILLENCGSVEAISHAAQKITESVGRPVWINGQEVFTSISTGISLFPKDSLRADELISQADMAMYKAKRHGGDRVEFYARELGERLARFSKIEDGIKRGLKRSEFVAHFQPKIDLRSSTISSCEALARWNDPVNGVVSPAEFIPVAEKSTLIEEITQQMLLQACQLLQQLPADSNFSVSVNLSAVDLQNRELDRQITRLLQQHALEPCQLELEVTESMMMIEMDLAIEMLGKLRLLGVKVSLDDFGTGYSSLSYLKKFPIDTLKIDRSFIKDIDGNTGSPDRTIVKSIITMAKALGIQVVAEGVETPEQVAFLRAVGCDFVQGFYFAKPMPEQQLIAFLQELTVDSIEL